MDLRRVTSRSRPSPNFSPSSPIVLEPVSPRRAPPGFPTPIFGKDHIGKLPTCLPVQWDSMASPRSDNLRYFDKTFGGADKLSTEDEKISFFDVIRMLTFPITVMETSSWKCPMDLCTNQVMVS